jgi:drug/metabolite transporter (DMT)-like permease
LPGRADALWFNRRSFAPPTAMTPTKLAGIVLIIAGVLALVYGGFSYTKQTHDVKVGPIEFAVKEKQTVAVPVWAGVGAIVVGAALLAFGGKR